MSGEVGITTNELCELSGMSRQRLDYWRRECGLFEPTETSRDNYKKAGYRYDLQAVQTVLTVSKLREQGVSLQKIQKAVSELENYGEKLSGAVLYADEETDGLYRVREKDDVLESLTDSPGQLESLSLISLDDVDEKARDFFEEKGRKVA